FIKKERLRNQETYYVGGFLLFFCSEDLRRWFLQQEMDLLRYRFNELTENLRQKFLEYVNLSFEAV
ncbi:PREDICTED: DNA primase large subunit-like, partial [Apaloderma vittatum]|uniref:DNA primase large subunit-like n=1 Tax=Apaloderma vittatum TaxID=57397 RepID=UPI0005217F47